MPEPRYDPLGRRTVLLAPERAKRGTPPVEPTRPDPAPCDFCGGCEDRTPPETFSVRHDGSAPDIPGWTVRAVPNLYPATPFHEVVVHSPDHLEQFEDQPPERRSDVLIAYRERLSAAPTAANLVIWNRGQASGASRTHAHGQIFGLDAPPPTLEREMETLREDPCVVCDFAADRDLLIGDVDGYRVAAHPVPLVAGELLIVPPHTPAYTDSSDANLASCAEAIRLAIAGTLGILGAGVPFNLAFHSAPRGTDDFHWHAHLMPRTAIWGGLEMGAELPIVAGDPAETARELRAV